MSGDHSEPGRQDDLREIEAAARALGVQLELLQTRSSAELDGALVALARGRADGILIQSSPMLFGQRARIAQFATEHRLPITSAVREYVEAGCLMSYGASLSDLARRAAYFVDKILRGAKPADLPVEQPSKFELVMNLKAAKALGLTIPTSLLQRADQIIDR